MVGFGGVWFDDCVRSDHKTSHATTYTNLHDIEICASVCHALIDAHIVCTGIVMHKLYTREENYFDIVMTLHLHLHLLLLITTSCSLLILHRTHSFTISSTNVLSSSIRYPTLGAVEIKLKLNSLSNLSLTISK